MSAPFQVAQCLREVLGSFASTYVLNTFCIVDRGHVVVHTVRGGYNIPANVQKIARQLGEYYGVPIEII